MLLRMTRPGFLLLTAAACLLGLALAWAGTGAWDAPRAGATLLLALLAHAGANVLNDYHDARNGADAANQQGLFPFTGGSRLIQQGAVSERATQRWAWTLLALLLPAGLALVWASGPGLLGIGLAGLLLAWGYSAPPLALMSRGLGELAVGLAWWLVVLGADYVQRRQGSASTALAALGLALLVANVLLVNGLPDARADALVGKRTLAVRLGPRAAAWLYLALALLAHGGLLALWWRGWLPVSAWAGLASLPLALAAALQVLRHAGQPQALRPAIGLSIAAAIGHALALALGLVLWPGAMA
ncbi:hypothetical protein MASR1M59_05900 [Melaminivora sp.]